jgi:hypothetical protein
MASKRKGLLLGILFFLIVFLSFTSISALTNLSNCGELNITNEYYILINNVSSSLTCFNITADNVVLDGNGYNITFGTSGNSSNGVFVGLKNNATIKNLKIYESGVFGNTRYGVNLLRSNYSTVQNNNIITSGLNGYGIYALSSQFDMFDSNNVTTSGTSAFAVYLQSTHNSTIYKNIITTSGSTSQAVYLQTASQNNLTSNNITAITLNSVALYLASSAQSNKINSNNILSKGGNGYVIYVASCLNEEINSNLITSTGNNAYGIYLSTSANGNVLNSNIFNITSGHRIIIDGSSINTNLTNNTIINRKTAFYDLSASAGSNNLYLKDQIHLFQNYSFAGLGSSVKIEDSTYGQIIFNALINGTGNNLSNDIRISDNFVFVNDTVVNGGLNKNANITLYNIGNRGFSNVTILKNGETCPSNVCTNYTSLTATNVIFKVTNWSNYSIGEVGADTISPIITFNSQTPSDLSSLNAVSVGLDIKYNITDAHLNLSSIYMFYKLNSSISDISFFINGSAISGWGNDAYTSSSSSTYSWLMGDNEVYPATYNLEDDVFDVTPHNLNTLTTNQNYISIQLLNLTNSTQYNFFEVMSNSSASQQVYYCNSSYGFASDPISNPVNSPRCTLAGTISAGSPYNHTHSSYSSHQVLPIVINTTSGQIGTVKVTPTSYFLIRGVGGGGNNINYYSVPNITRLGAMRTTTNNGALWTNQTYTVDAHLHQYSGVESFYYYVCANDTLNNANCSSIRQDSIELVGLPPSSPIVNSPLAYYYSGNLDINYTESISPNGYAISYYNISLLDSLFAFNKTIVANNSLNLNYTWNTVGTTDGLYIIRVQACDVLNQCSFGYSEIFGIDNTNPNGILMQPIDNLYTNISLVNFTVNASDNVGLQNITLYIYNGSVLIDTQTQSVSGQTGIFGIIYNFLFDGIYKWFYQIIDSAGNIFTTQNRTIIMDTVYPQLSIDFPLNITYNYQIDNVLHTVNETNLANCTIDNGITTSLITCNAINYINATENLNTWTLTATDLAGQAYAKQVVFFQDTTYPQIDFSVGTLPNNTKDNVQSLFVNVSITESNFYSITYNLGDDTSLISSMTFYSPYTSVLFTNLTEGNLYYNVSIQDIAGNVNTTSTRKYILDITPPNVVINSPLAQNYTNNSLLINITSDGYQVFFLNGIQEQYYSPVYRTYPEGYTNITAIASDDVGNENETSVLVFIDSLPPSLSFVSPSELNNQIQAKNYIRVNLSVTDANFKNSTIYLYNSTSLLAYTEDTINPYYVQFTNLSNGIYHFNATACDSYDNCRNSVTRKVTINQGLGANLSLTLEVPQYPYVDANLSYFISLLFEYNPVITDGDVTIVITELDGSNTTIPLIFNPTSERYENNIIFNTTGNYPFVIHANSTNFGYINATGTFWVRNPYYVNVLMFTNNGADDYINDYGYVTAEYLGTQKIYPILETYIHPLTDTRYIQPAFHSAYNSGQAQLKLYESDNYVFRFLDGQVNFDGTYAQPNVTKSYGTEIYLGTQTLNGTSTTLQYVLEERDLHPYRNLANWAFFIILGLAIISGIFIFFMYPQNPMVALVFTILLGVGAFVMRVSVFLFLNW